MRWLTNIFGPRSKPAKSSRPLSHRPLATIDNATTTDENRKHWAEVDNYSAVAQLTPEVRKRLRERARYECQNNSYAAGLIRTLVNDTVGRGPRLQMESDSVRLNNAVESLWRDWSAACDFALNMRIVAAARYVSGEVFALPMESRRLQRYGLPVDLDFRLIEPEQCTDPFSLTYLTRQYGDDGVECDDQGEVTGYRFLRYHPGDYRISTADFTKTDLVSADRVIHWYIPDRPGQLRGITPLTPSLGIFAQLRRFTMATLTSAEIAAMLSGVMEQDGALGTASSEVTSFDSFGTIDIARGMLMTLPPGAKISQFRPEHPTTNYDTFVAAKLREAGRVLSVPYGKMAGDHSAYNYSSGRLDDAPYWSDREIERQALEAKVFNPILRLWFDFAKFSIPGLVRYEGRWWELRHSWHYDARPTSDPVKDATGDEMNLTNGTDTLAAIAARDGTTVESLLDQRQREMQMYMERGLPLPPWLSGTPAPSRVGDGQPQDPNAARSTAEVLP